MTAAAVELRPDDPLPAGVDAVATALPATRGRPSDARLTAGVPFASTVDEADAIGTLLELRRRRHADVLLAPGCGLAPGLADVLARHAASALGAVDEIHVARAGSADPPRRRRSPIPP